MADTQIQPNLNVEVVDIGLELLELIVAVDLLPCFRLEVLRVRHTIARRPLWSRVPVRCQGVTFVFPCCRSKLRSGSLNTVATLVARRLYWSEK